MKSRRGRLPQVVDTNVIVVANRRHGESYACASACANVLVAIKSTGTLVVEDQDRILREYRGNASMAGQPGVGDAFIKWAHDNIGRPELVSIVRITPKFNGAEDYEEFPNHPDLASFDPSDRKFVAVSNVHPDRPKIQQGLDSKWWMMRNALAASGITVNFLCPTEIEKLNSRKLGG